MSVVYIGRIVGRPDKVGTESERWQNNADGDTATTT
jgi:hypothetical protein